MKYSIFSKKKKIREAIKYYISHLSRGGKVNTASIRSLISVEYRNDLDKIPLMTSSILTLAKPGIEGERERKRERESHV